MINENDVIVLIKTYYSREASEVIKLSNKAYKVTCENKFYLFKVSTGSSEFLVKQLQAHRAMSKHVLPIYKTNANAYCIQFDQYFCYLTDYILPIPLTLEKRVLLYVDILTQLHQQTHLSIEVDQAALTQLYDTQYKQLQDSYEQLQKQMKSYELTPERSPYEWYFMMVYPMIYGMLQRAHDELKKFYDIVSKESKLPVCLAHIDVNVANIVVSEQAAYILNFEKSMFTFAAIDMCLLLENYHHIQGIKSSLLTYLKKEEKVMQHFFFFKTLTFDVTELYHSLTDHSLMNTALLNERLAPHILALQLFDAINTPTTTAQA